MTATKTIFISLVASAISFCLGTFFTPIVQPGLFWIADRAGGCALPFAQAQELIGTGGHSSDDVRRIAESDVRAAYDLFVKASSCNTPLGSEAQMSAAVMICAGLFGPVDGALAHRMLHDAGSKPGASFARYYHSLEYCLEQQR